MKLGVSGYILAYIYTFMCISVEYKCYLLMKKYKFIKEKNKKLKWGR